MTIQHAGPLIESGLFDGPRFGVMLSLTNHADDYGESFPSYYAIACEARCERETAIRTVKWLQEKGVIVVMQGDDRPADKRGSCGRANVYRVHLDLINQLSEVVRMAKSRAGRQPKKRYEAVKLIGKWAEEVIGESGADICAAALREIIQKGDLGSLLPSGNSDRGSPSTNREGDPRSPSEYPQGDPRSPSRGREGDPDDGEGDPGTPKPSNKPSLEPSGENFENGKGENVDGKALRMQRLAERRVLVEWLLSGWVYAGDTIGLKTERLRADPDKAESQTYALRQSQQSINRVASWAEWAINVASGADPKEPTKTEVIAILANLRRADEVAQEYGRDPQHPMRQRMATLIAAKKDLRSSRETCSGGDDDRQTEDAA